MYEIVNADNVEAMANMAAESVAAVVCDPQYGLSQEPDPVEVLRSWLEAGDYAHGKPGFMGRKWDSFVPGPVVWRQALRVLKPGGHLVAFGATRTYDWLTLAIRLAGFEVRDSLHWMYGSGFPKSLDVSKAIDKAAGAEREVIGTTARCVGPSQKEGYHGSATFREAENNPGNLLTAPATPEASTWEGWGTALKPAHEPIVLARKPLIGTVAANVLRYGTGALNVDGCRVATSETITTHSRGVNEAFPKRPGETTVGESGRMTVQNDIEANPHNGRWPPNLLLTHSADCGEAGCAPDCPVRLLDEQSGTTTSGAMRREVGAYSGDGVTGFLRGRSGPSNQHADSGGASRFFPTFSWDPEYDLPGLYCAKASTSERETGRPDDFESKRWNVHPTVKPVALMRWLLRLVTPPGGVVLDPFCGSGTTLAASMLEGFSCTGIEQEVASAEIARLRAKYALRAAALASLGL